jgi:hypothetical protein
MEQSKLLAAFLKENVGQVNALYEKLDAAVPDGANTLCVSYAAIEMVASGITQVFNNKEKALLAVEFYQQILELLVNKLLRNGEEESNEKK